MCGLIAVINKYNNGFTKSQCDAFNDLIYLDALRGMDSTGAFVITNRDDLYMAKNSLWLTLNEE